VSGCGLFFRWDCCIGKMAFVLFMHGLRYDDPIDHSRRVTSVVETATCLFLPTFNRFGDVVSHFE
jgi:hypothetical protein